MTPAIRALVFIGGVIAYYKLSRAGKLHFHKCECGNLWVHGSEMFGNKDAHRCRKCGRLQWHVFQTSMKGGMVK